MARIRMRAMGRATPPLIRAAMEGSAPVVRALLAYHADPSIRSLNGRSALSYAVARHATEVVNLLRPITPTTLQEAARLGDPDKVRIALASDPDVNEIDRFGTTALTEAAKSGSGEVVRLLLAHGASAHLREKHGRTALHVAAQMGDIDMMTELLKSGADIDSFAPLPIGRTPLLDAVACGQASAVAFLLGQHIDLHKHDQGFVALSMAVGTSGRPEQKPDGSYLTDEKEMLKQQDRILSMLLQLGIDLRTHDGVLTHDAAQAGQTGVLKLLLERGADPNGKDESGETALMAATTDWLGQAEMQASQKDGSASMSWDPGEAKNNAKEAVQLLLAYGADVNLKNRRGETVLMQCDGSAGAESARLFLEQNAKIGLRDKEGRSALHLAASNNELDVAKLLIAKHALVDARDTYGFTPLMLAIGGEALYETAEYRNRPTMARRPRVEEHIPMVKLLLAAGADPHLEAKNKMTAITIAKRRDLPKTLDALQHM